MDADTDADPDLAGLGFRTPHGSDADYSCFEHSQHACAGRSCGNANGVRHLGEGCAPIASDDVQQGQVQGINFQLFNLEGVQDVYFELGCMCLCLET